MSVKMRQEVERKIATAAIQSLLQAGFALSVDNGGDEYELSHSTDQTAILKAMFLCDEDRLYVEKESKTFGWIYFVYGNDGWDVISDYTVNLESFIGEGTEAYKISEYYA
jgi:hypothetical protein